MFLDMMLCIPADVYRRMGRATAPIFRVKDNSMQATAGNKGQPEFSASFLLACFPNLEMEAVPPKRL
jgi:hypothetical protein